MEGKYTFLHFAVIWWCKIHHQDPQTGITHWNWIFLQGSMTRRILKGMVHLTFDQVLHEPIFWALPFCVFNCLVLTFYVYSVLKSSLSQIRKIQEIFFKKWNHWRYGVPFTNECRKANTIFGQKKLQKNSENKLGPKNQLYHKKELKKLRPGQKLGGAYLHCNAMQCIEGPWQYIAYSANFTN